MGSSAAPGSSHDPGDSIDRDSQAVILAVTALVFPAATLCMRGGMADSRCLWFVLVFVGEETNREICESALLKSCDFQGLKDKYSGAGFNGQATKYGFARSYWNQG